MNNTPQSIADALMRLLETKLYAKVTIHNICEATPISRNAFYYHFDGKEAVVKWIALQHYLKYCLPYFKIREGNISAKSFFQYVADYRGFYTAIYQADDGMLLRRCLNEAYAIGLDREHVVEYAAPTMNSRERVSFATCLTYCNAGTAAVVAAWVAEGMKTPVETMAHDLSMLMTRSLEDIRDHHLY